MKELFFDEFKVDEFNLFDDENYKIKENTYNTAFLDNRFNHQDVRIMIMTEYRGGKLDFRKELKIVKTKEMKNINFNENEVIELICMNYKGKYKNRNGKVALKIGTAKYLSEDKENIIVKPLTIEGGNSIYDLFEIIGKPSKIKIVDDTDEKLVDIKNDMTYKKYLTEDEQKLKNKYLGEKGLFKYYYYSLFKFYENNSQFFNIAKLSALTFYEVAKKYFMNHGETNISLPNVFIKDFDVEFDMLLLKEDVDSQKLFFNIKDVKAIVELKTRGLFFGKDTIYNTFIDYMNFNLGKEKFKEENDCSEELKKSARGKYDNTKEEIKKLPYIYFCLDETDRGTETPYYETSYRAIKEDKKIGIFVCLTKDHEHYLIPIEQDFDI